MVRFAPHIVSNTDHRAVSVSFALLYNVHDFAALRSDLFHMFLQRALQLDEFIERLGCTGF